MKEYCARCGYEWKSKCKEPKCCPRWKSYRYMFPKKDSLMQTASENPNKLPKQPPSKKIIDHPNWMKPNKPSEVNENDT